MLREEYRGRGEKQRNGEREEGEKGRELPRQITD
jgi:hypothetical protein